MAILYDQKTKTYYIDAKIKKNDGTYYHFKYKEVNNPDFKIKRYVQSKEHEIIESKKRELYVNIPSIQNLNELYERYIRNYEDEYSIMSIKSMDWQFNYLSNFFSNSLAQFFNVSKLEEYRTTISKKDTSLSNKKRYLLLARKLIDYSRKIKLIDSDTKDDCLYILENIKQKVNDQKESKNGYTSIHDLQLMINQAQNENDKTLLQLLYFSGLRIGEFLGIKVSDITFQKDLAIIYIKRQKLPNGVITDRLKTNSSYKKIAYVNENVLLLKKYIERNYLKEDDFLFDAYSRHNIRKLIAESATKAGVSSNTIHGFGRKSINTELYKLGADGKTRTILLGQSSISVNEENYIDNDETFKIGINYLNKITK